MVERRMEGVRQRLPGRGDTPTRSTPPDAWPKPTTNTRAETLEWPPADDLLASRISSFGRRQVEPVRNPAAIDADDTVNTESEPEPTGNAPRLLQIEHEPHVALRHEINRRASAKVPAMPPGRSGSSGTAAVSGHHLGRLFLLSALIGVAIFDVYILRAAWVSAVQQAAVPAQSPAVPAVVATAQEARRDGSVKAKASSVVQSTSSAGAGATVAIPSPATSGTGGLIIQSEPSGAKVLVDGRSSGVTPTTLQKVVPGEHVIVLQRAGIKVRQTVRVEPGATVSVVAPLPLPPPLSSGWMSIVAPIEIDVFAEDALIGTSRSPKIMLEAGLHTLILVNEHLAFRQTEQVRIQPGQLTQVAVNLPQSTMHINASPWAEVWIDGKAIGETPIGNLPIVIGKHEVVFRHPELGERVISTVVRADVATRLTADLRQPTTPRR